MSKNGKLKRYDDDLVIHRFSTGSLMRPGPETLDEIQKAFFPEPPKIYFYIHDLEGSS